MKKHIDFAMQIFYSGFAGISTFGYMWSIVNPEWLQMNWSFWMAICIYLFMGILVSRTVYTSSHWLRNQHKQILD